MRRLESPAEIPFEEVTFHPMSFDSRGRLFQWKGDLYRGIVKEHAPFYKGLLENGVAQKLIDKRLLIETELTDLTLRGYALVLKHRRVPFVSYANEWCAEMLRDAARLNADLTLELVSMGLRLTDAATWNILFDGCRPVMVDFSSIVAADYESDKDWRIYEEDFYSYFINPLRLMTQGYGHLARWLLADCEHDVIQREFAQLLGYRSAAFPHLSKKLLPMIENRIPEPVRPLARNGFRMMKAGFSRLNSFRHRGECDLVQQLRHELENIPLASDSAAQADGKEDDDRLSPGEQRSEEQLVADRVLSDLSPSTILDIGANQGWYWRRAALLGRQVVVLDAYESGISECYRQARKKNLPILPLVIDIRYPSPGQGTAYRILTPALDRLRCDVVLAFSLVHLLVFDYRLTFELVCETLGTLTKKWLLVEFLAPEHRKVRAKRLDRYPWYSSQGFIDNLQKWFVTVRQIPSATQHQVFLLCQK
jgi:hypothetical protein